MDTNRAESPLKQSEDAIFIDTTGYTLEEVADKIGVIINEKRDN